jgi:hypothetical protein
MKNLILLYFVCAQLLAFAQDSTATLNDRHIYVKAKRELSSRSLKLGEKVDFEVIQDVYIHGKLVVEEGTTVQGEVIVAQKKQLVGGPGRLEILIREVEGINQEFDIIGPILYSEGRSRRGLACGLAIISPLFLLIPGNEAYIYTDTEIELELEQERPHKREQQD